nr:nicotinate-nucleotide--dimethylbenzimidazole phosphoribosyltransferase [Corynebacterium aquatimens]
MDDYLHTPTGAIDVEPAMSLEACLAALELGKTIADQEIDAGTDLIVPGDVGVGNTTVAAALYGVCTRTEPAQAIGRGSGISDEVWKTKVAAVRDAMFRARGFRDDLERVMAEISGPDFACLVGLIAQSAARRTPVLIDGAYPAVAAYVAERLAPGTKRWLIAGQLSPEPAHLTCVQALGLTPVLALDMVTGQAAGALAALPTMNLAAELVGDLLDGAAPESGS